MLTDWLIDWLECNVHETVMLTCNLSYRIVSIERTEKAETEKARWEWIKIQTVSLFLWTEVFLTSAVPYWTIKIDDCV